MKKLCIFSLVCGALLPFTSAMADPSIIEISFTCPTVSGPGIYVLTNFGNRIGGYGVETIGGVPSSPSSPYFTYNIPGGSNIPKKLSTGSYSSSGTDFDSETGVVSCSYTSSSTFDPFTVNYVLTNGNGAVISSQSPNSITLNQYLGLKA